MKKILEILFDHKALTREAAKELMISMARGEFRDAELSSLITVFLMRSITIAELEGFRDGLLEVCLRPAISGEGLLDIVGTGGDGKNTFNISTLACFIAAGAGCKIAKHGNYGATSVSGSSNLMETLGYKFSADEGKLKTELEEAGLCFLHAPVFHPALKLVGPVRKTLGFRTFFNMLGPLVNPVDPQYKFIGVYNLESARFYKYILQQTSSKFTIVHALEGYDEISLTGDTRVISRCEERNYSAQELGKRTVSAKDIAGGQSVSESARIFTSILEGKGSWSQNAVVLANAAMGISLARQMSYEKAYDAAVDSLESSAAFNTLKKLISLQ